MPELVVEIINKKGLHARAAAKFVKIVAAHEAQVMVTCPGGEAGVNGGSILGLMMLGADAGSKLTIVAEGRQAEMVLAALKTLVENRFDEPE